MDCRTKKGWSVDLGGVNNPGYGIAPHYEKRYPLLNCLGCSVIFVVAFVVFWWWFFKYS